MEGQRNEVCALHGICLRTTLVLVSSVPDSDAEWRDHCLPPAGLDAIAGSHGRAQHVFGDRLGVAAFRNYTARLSSVPFGRETAFPEYILRPGHGGFRPNRSDPEIRFRNLPWRVCPPH